MGQGPAPAGATIEHFRAEGLDLVPGAGGLAAAVPGSVDAWLLLLRDHGTWELADVLAYAIGYARDGHPLLAQAARHDRARRGPVHASTGRPRRRCGCRTGACPRPARSCATRRMPPSWSRLVAAGHAIRDDGPVGRDARIDAARAGVEDRHRGAGGRRVPGGAAPPLRRARPRRRDHRARLRRLRRRRTRPPSRSSSAGTRSRRPARGRRARRCCRRCRSSTASPTTSTRPPKPARTPSSRR